MALPDSLHALAQEEALLASTDPLVLMRALSAANKASSDAARAERLAKAEVERLLQEGPDSSDSAAALPPAREAVQAAERITAQAREARMALAQRTSDLIERSRLLRALRSPRQLEEVMVAFWFNHFNVARDKGHGPVLTAHFELAAIRPHALGSFRELLGAVAHHPAMLSYLDNTANTAARGLQGVNENFARELMELHTLGVHGGYTQADVTELARMFTGWTHRPLADTAAAQAAVQTDARYPGFAFQPKAHDGRPKRWFGHAVEAQGQAEGEFALDVLASHPSTARFIARKLAQAFVEDDPPEAVVRPLADAFTRHQGRIQPVLQTLFESDAFWSPHVAGAKFKTPYQQLLSMLRATDAPVEDVRPLVSQLTAMGMPLHQCSTPDGYPDLAARWRHPDALAKRANLAHLLAKRQWPRGAEARVLSLAALREQLGPLLPPEAASAPPQAAGTTARPALDEPMRIALALTGPRMLSR